MTVMKFAKRFDCLALKEKMATAEKLAVYLAQKKMPSGFDMLEEEYETLKGLSHWCDDNIFFGVYANQLGEYVTITKE